MNDEKISTSFDFIDSTIDKEVYEKISRGIYNTLVFLYNDKYLSCKPLEVVTKHKQTNKKRFNVEMVFKENPSEDDFPIGFMER